jgi:hypothetical protein
VARKKPTTRVENGKPKYLIDTKRNEPLASELGRRPEEKPHKPRLHENTQEKLVELKKKQVVPDQPEPGDPQAARRGAEERPGAAEEARGRNGRGQKVQTREAVRI